MWLIVPVNCWITSYLIDILKFLNDLIQIDFHSIRQKKWKEYLGIVLFIGWAVIGKGFPCDECKFIGRDNYQLKMHKKTHTGERPFKVWSLLFIECLV